MHIDEAGLKLIEGFEGYSGVQYRDCVGVPTIGYGTTAADVNPLPKTCTRAQAEQWLRENITRQYEPPVNGLGVPLNQNQFDALVSLCYNCGPGAMQWQIGRDLRARNYTAAANDFMHYVYAGGQVIQGLVNRRAAERALFLHPATPPVPPKPGGLFEFAGMYQGLAHQWLIHGVAGHPKFGVVNKWASASIELIIGGPNHGSWSLTPLEWNTKKTTQQGATGASGHFCFAGSFNASNGKWTIDGAKSDTQLQWAPTPQTVSVIIQVCIGGPSKGQWKTR